MNIEEALHQLGSYRMEGALSALRETADQMVARAGTAHPGPRFEALPSFIPSRPPSRKRSGVLSIDIGGTSTKVGIRLRGPEGLAWRVLFEQSNDDIQGPASIDHSLERYAAGLAARICSGLLEADVPAKAITSCGIVWSNACVNRRTPQGIAAIMTRGAGESSYRKGEWFNRDLTDGYEISGAFLRALVTAGINLTTIAVSNDTPFTMKALDGADGGIVASTGVNGTICKSALELGIGPGADLIVCNAEMGGGLKIPPELLSPADMMESTDGSGRVVPCSTIEDLIAGRFLPQVLAEYVVQCADLGVTELTAAAQALRALGAARFRSFGGEDLSLLLTDNQLNFNTRHAPLLGNLSAAEMGALKSIATHLVTRAAGLTALVAWATVSHQYTAHHGQPNPAGPANVAVDSRLAREMPLFWRVLRDQIKKVAPPEWPVHLSLLEPIRGQGGFVSVPMQGAANTIDCL